MFLVHKGLCWIFIQEQPSFLFVFAYLSGMWAVRVSQPCPLTRGAPSSSTWRSCQSTVQARTAQTEGPRVTLEHPAMPLLGCPADWSCNPPHLGGPVGLRQGGWSLRTRALSLRGTLAWAHPAPDLSGIKTAVCLRVELGPQPTSSWCSFHHTCSYFVLFFKIAYNYSVSRDKSLSLSRRI